MIPAFYTVRPEWAGRIESIVEAIGRVGALEERSGHTLELRRANRIGSVHSSTAIEGNQLSLAQARAVAGGHPVHAAPRQVQEVANALAAYEALPELDPWSVDDFLTAHRLLTAGLQDEAGEFRSVDVDIINADGEVIHSGSRVEKVPRLIAELFEWGSTSSDHPVVVSSAAHFLIEHIHPFRDGNGRIGRLWQTLILSKWRPMFAWTPTETLIRRSQGDYYRALQASREPEIDAGYFVDFMLDVIAGSLAEYEAHARGTEPHVGTNVGITDALIDLIRADPSLSAPAIAERLGRTPRTIERHLSELKAEGRIRREGSRKAGRWIVLEESHE